MVSFLFNVLISIIDFCLILHISKCASNELPRHTWLFLLALGIIVAVPTITATIQNQALLSFINFFSYLLLCVISGRIFQLNFAYMLFWGTTFMSIAMLSESTAITFLDFISLEIGFSTLSFTYYFFGSLISCTLRIIFVLIINHLLLKKSLMVIPSLPKNLTLMLSAIPVASIVILNSVYFLVQAYTTVSSLFFFSVYLGIAILSICSLYMYQKIQRYFIRLIQNQTSEAVTKEQIRHFTELEQKHEEIRRMNHDLKNQYQILSAHIETKEYAQALNFIAKSVEKLDYSNVNFYTNNFLLNYLLNQKIQQIDSKAKKIISVMIPKDFKVDDNIITALLGNLLDNAINAVNRQKNGNKSISISLNLSAGNFIIDINNTFDTKEIQTRKERLMKGLGLKNVEQIVESLHGLYKHKIESNIYHVSVVLLNMYKENDKHETKKTQRVKNNKESSLKHREI